MSMTSSGAPKSSLRKPANTTTHNAQRTPQHLNTSTPQPTTTNHHTPSPFWLSPFPAEVGDALGRLWAGSPFFFDVPILFPLLRRSWRVPASLMLLSRGLKEMAVMVGAWLLGWLRRRMRRRISWRCCPSSCSLGAAPLMPVFSSSTWLRVLRCLMSAMLRQGTWVLYVEAALGAAAAFFQKEWFGVASAAAAAAFLVSSRILLRDAGKSPGKFEGKTVKRIFEFTGFLACDPQVMIHGTQAAALLSAARTYASL